MSQSIVPPPDGNAQVPSCSAHLPDTPWPASTHVKVHPHTSKSLKSIQGHSRASHLCANGHTPAPADTNRAGSRPPLPVLATPPASRWSRHPLVIGAPVVQPCALLQPSWRLQGGPHGCTDVPPPQLCLGLRLDHCATTSDGGAGRAASADAKPPTAADEAAAAAAILVLAPPPPQQPPPPPKLPKIEVHNSPPA